MDGRFQLWNVAKLRRFQQIEDNSNHHLHTDESALSAWDKPLLFHYRFPISELYSLQGMVWRPFDASDDQPLWTGLNNRRVLNQTRSNQSERSISNEVQNDSNQGSASRLPNSNINNGRSSILRHFSNSTVKMHRITACRALPSSEGIGFLAVTKNGMMSLFRPAFGDKDQVSF